MFILNIISIAQRPSCILWLAYEIYQAWLFLQSLNALRKIKDFEQTNEIVPKKNLKEHYPNNPAKNPFHSKSSKHNSSFPVILNVWAFCKSDRYFQKMIYMPTYIKIIYSIWKYFLDTDRSDKIWIFIT